MSSLIEFYIRIIDRLWHANGSQPFHYPVNYQQLGLYDYPLIIKRPMSLSTVKKKSLEGLYQTPYDFEADLMLIWENCKRYNLEGSEIYKTAEVLEDLSRILLKEGLQDPRVPELVKKEDLLHKRLRLNKIKSRLGLKDLKRMLVLIRDENPDAMEFSTDKSFTVSLDLLRPEVIDKLLSMFQESESDHKI